ncbi:MAG: LysM peptidoglycan-binding domain-containing M23 family metallopeptidase [Anaerolineae bacterium]|nr:LysM peptidoglycan-binding domain-containing M23 family metallopeptidase [Anaerolineae bacterium]
MGNRKREPIRSGQHARRPRFEVLFLALLTLTGSLLLALLVQRLGQTPSEPMPPKPIPLPTFPPDLTPEAGVLPSEEVIIRDAPPGNAAASPAHRGKRELREYTVVEGDTVFGIALKFGLRPETILWSNYDQLKDNFDLIRVGQKFIIPPENGLIIEVERGDTLDGIARRYGVKPEAIVNEPINKLTSINQPLQIGQVLFIPGGERETVIWQVPKLIPLRRTATGVRVYRVGKCGEVAIPRLGTGSFIYPTNRRYLSGYDFGRYHPGLDFAGRLGEPIYASDAGTVIYAGYSLNAAGVPVGYGQYVVLDHGNGYQTLYAHASQLYVRCGQQVPKGAVIAAIGSVGRSTGPHLHYEIRYQGMAVNPWTLLPPRY